MAKPITHFVLAKGAGFGRWGRSSFRVVGVTSIRGRQVYGRELPGEAATHLSQWDVIHKFPDGTTLEEAVGAIRRAEDEHALHTKEIAATDARGSALREAQRLATMAAAKGVRCEHTKTPPSPSDVTPQVGPNDGTLPPEHVQA